MGDGADKSDEISEERDEVELTKQVGIRALKQNASAVIARVANGEELIVTDRGRPVAHIIPIKMTPLERKFMELQISQPKHDISTLPEPARGEPLTPILRQMREDERY